MGILGIFCPRRENDFSLGVIHVDFSAFLSIKKKKKFQLKESMPNTVVFFQIKSSRSNFCAAVFTLEFFGINS